jgi:hypothetical protein
MQPDPKHTDRCYILDDNGKPQREPDFGRWLAWMQAHDEPLAETDMAAGVRVSTRFVGFDQRRTQIGAPVLWETMIFGGPHDLHQVRYTSQAAAMRGHEKAVAFAKDQSN